MKGEERGLQEKVCLLSWWMLGDEERRTIFVGRHLPFIFCGSCEAFKLSKPWALKAVNQPLQPPPLYGSLRKRKDNLRRPGEQESSRSLLS